MFKKCTFINLVLLMPFMALGGPSARLNNNVQIGELKSFSETMQPKIHVKRMMSGGVFEKKHVYKFLNQLGVLRTEIGKGGSIEVNCDASGKLWTVNTAVEQYLVDVETNRKIYQSRGSKALEISPSGRYLIVSELAEPEVVSAFFKTSAAPSNLWKK